MKVVAVRRQIEDAQKQEKREQSKKSAVATAKVKVKTLKTVENALADFFGV